MFIKVVNDDSVIMFIYRVDLVLNSIGGFIRGIYLGRLVLWNYGCFKWYNCFGG